MEKPLVSVITPAYNAAAFITDCIESVLLQNYPCLEHIIVDDGSSDRTLSICTSYAEKHTNIHIFQHGGGRNLGVSASRELALEKAQGEYVVFLDADDLFLPHKVSTQVKAFNDHPEVILVHTAVKALGFDRSFCDQLEKWMNFSPTPFLYQLLHQAYAFKNNRITNSTVMVRRSEITKIPIPRLKYQYEDWFIWVMFSQHGPYLYLPEVTTLYRIHKHSFTGRLRQSSRARHWARLEFFYALRTRMPASQSPLSRIRFLRLTINELYVLCKAILTNKQRL